MGGLLAELPRQREHDPLRQDQPTQQVEVGAHAFLAHLEPLGQHRLHAGQQGAGVDEQLRQRRPLDAPGGAVALVQLERGIGERHHLCPHQPRQRADQVDRRRVPLVRHGAAAHLSRPAALAYLVDFAALQVVDLVRHPAQRHRHLDQQPGNLQHPVPGAVPTGRRRAEAKPGQGSPL